MEAPGSVADSDSDISLISDEEVEVAAPSSSGARLSGPLAPKAWSEVDANQLSQLALRIAQRTLPDADKGGEPLIIASSTSDHTQSLPHDPLGLGVGTSGQLLTTSTAAGGNSSDDPSGWTDPRLLPSSPSYDPELHSVAAYKDIPWVDLIRGLDRLRSEVREHTGQLKSLVKENFDRFLSSKDTVDDIAVRLKAAEAEKGAGVHGATPAEVAMGMARSQNAAHGMFGQLLERHAKGESLRVMLGMLGEYDSLVGLPAQVRQCAEARDFAGVLTLYKKAVKVVEERSTREGKINGGESHAVWEKLQAEVNRAISSAVHVLVATVDSPTTSLLSAADAAQHLAQLRQAGVPAAMDLDPALIFLSAQVRAITATIESCQRDFTSALSALEKEFELRKRRKQALDLNFSSNSAGAGGEVQHGHRHRWQRWWWEQQHVFQNDNLTSSEQLDLDSSIIEASFTDLWTMTESLINWLLDLLAATTLWKNQNRNEPSSTSSKEAAAIWETQHLAIEEAAIEVLNAYSKAVVGISQALLKSDALWDAAGISGVVDPLISTLVAGYVAFEQHFNGNISGTSTSTNTKSEVHFVTGRLRSLVREVAEASFSAIETALPTSARHFALATLATSESHNNNNNNNIDVMMMGVTSNAVVPPPAASLRLLLCCGMRWSITLCAHCTQADIDAGETSLQPYKILCSTAMAFVEATVERILEMHPSDTTWPSVSVVNRINSHGPASQGCRDSRLLQAWEILRSVGNTVIPQVFTAFEPNSGVSLHASKNNSATEAATAAIRSCSHQIESLGDGVIRAYLDRKLSLLDGIMEDFLSPIVPEAAAETGETVDAAAFTEACALVANWKKNYAPTHARPIVWTLLCTLGGIRTELLAYSPFLCKDVMVEVLQGVVGGVTELLESGFIETSPPERVYQLWLDVVVLQFAIKKLGDDGDGVEADVEKLCTALENAFSSGLKRCGEENCSSYMPPQGNAIAGSGGDGSEWAVSMGDHRRWVQKVCDTEVKRAESVMKAFSPQQQF
ncbi:hypothetical protein Ndes2526B_g03020 [Nannochloris sp. 'desiccata']|nr:hypothetical protein KSW81_006732 [Chlorella desiccata (nom. nud.)]